MFSRRLLGIVFIVAALAGVVFCVYGILQVWRFRPAAEQVAAETLDVASQTLVATGEGLAVIDEIVETTSEDIGVVETTVQTLTLTIENTSEALEAITILTGTDLPATITATQVSLASAQTSAALIDNMLASLARIPLLRLGVYQPEVPLATALGDVAESLDPLQPSLQTISLSLNSTSANLRTLDSELARISETTKAISTALGDAGEVVDDYLAITADLADRVERIEEAAPANIQTGAWLLTFLLLALLFPQFGLLERGLRLLRERRAESSDVVTE